MSVRKSAALHGQLLLALGAFATIALAPPAQGAMLLVSLTGMTHGELIDAATARDARIGTAGFGDHSLVVVGERARLTGLIGRGILVLGAPSPLCGRLS